MFQAPVLRLHTLLHRLVQHRDPQVSSMQGVHRQVQGRHVRWRRWNEAKMMIGWLTDKCVAGSSLYITHWYCCLKVYEESLLWLYTVYWTGGRISQASCAQVVYPRSFMHSFLFVRTIYFALIQKSLVPNEVHKWIVKSEIYVCLNPHRKCRIS